MVDKQEPHRDDAIAPASVNLNAQPRDSAVSGGSSIFRQHPVAMAALALSLVALAVVVFYLPSIVGPIDSHSNTRSTADAGAMSDPPLQPSITESPWQDAQAARARRDAQEILQQLLEIQQNLENMSVERWAAEAYQAALNQAQSGDKAYQSREFAQALGFYQDSLKRMQTLEEQSQQVFTSALEAGSRALDESDQITAQEQFQLAASIDAGHEAVRTGLQRAAALKTVLAELDSGRTLQRQGKLDEARARYQKALQLDGESRPAQAALADVDRAIAERDFGRHMSTGFAALSAGNHAAAAGAFEQALKVRPGAEDARAALVQAQNQTTQSRLQTLLQQAAAHEQNEEWQAAADRYQEALQVDGSLVEARVGSIRAGTRAEIDENLERILAAPQRLTTPTVRQEFQAFYEETRRISNPGPRLQRQLQELEQALHLAVQPVTVLFNSDSATLVTLYKVAELGSFQQRQLSLKPGSYTVVGSRPGYRDVRQTFTVSAGSQEAPVITIQCEEKINEG